MVECGKLKGKIMDAEKTKQLLLRIQTKVRGIYDHHTKPRHSRHGKTSGKCAEIEELLEQALAELPKQPESTLCLSDTCAIIDSQAEEIERLKELAYQLETNADPSGNVQEVCALRENQKGLEATIARLKEDLARALRDVEMFEDLANQHDDIQEVL